MVALPESWQASRRIAQPQASLAGTAASCEAPFPPRYYTATARYWRGRERTSPPSCAHAAGGDPTGKSRRGRRGADGCRQTFTRCARQRVYWWRAAFAPDQPPERRRMTTRDVHADLLYQRLLLVLQAPSALSRRQTPCHRPPQPNQPPSATPEASAPPELQLHSLLAAMGLTQRQADVARLRFAGLSIEEVAKRLGTSTRRVARIMEEVRRAMGG